MLEVFVGRQPIYNQQLKVIGYELLFRSYRSETAEFLNGDSATSQLILNTFMEIGLEQLVGGGLAFINLTRSFFLEKLPLPLLEDRVVIEVLENITIDDEFVEAVQFLSDRGYQIALDDVVNPDDVEPLLDIADIVKVDLVDIDRSRLEEYVNVFHKHKLKLLAEKIETHDEFELCKNLGFHYFQGFFFSKPKVISGHKMPESRLAILRLLSKLHTPGIEFKEMEDLISQDVSLSYKLLRLINSSFYARPKKIKSIRHALTFLGIRQIKDWVSLLSLAKVDDKPRELMNTAMVRAKMSEILALALKMKNAETGFTVGLFSVLDALLDLPLKEVIRLLPLSDDITSALLEHKGKFGEVLHCVLAYEHGEWEEAKCPGLEPDAIRDAYLESVNWTNNVASLL